MTRARGNEAWRALSDTHNSKGQLLPPEPDESDTEEPYVAVPSPLSRWFVQFRADVLAGRVSLENLIEHTDHDMQAHTVATCPECGKRPIRGEHRRASYQGICGICYLYRLRDRHLERLAEIEVEREVTAAKQAVRRARDELEPDRPRRLRVIRECASCGRKFAVPTSVDPDATLCVTCKAAPEPFAEYHRSNLLGTDAPLLVACSVCGDSYAPRGEGKCPGCEARRESRAEQRAAVS